jgi:hypothetical protein
VLKKGGISNHVIHLQCIAWGKLNMIKIKPEQIADYFKRSYTAVDGLWFMKLEDKYGFETALELDNEVWKVLPKIQARFFKAAGNLGDGLDALLECLSTKLMLEDFKFSVRTFDSPAGFEITISDCPWHNKMLKSGRQELSGKVGTLICNTEYAAWASEFGDNIKFKLKEQICEGSPHCILRFDSI